MAHSLARQSVPPQCAGLLHSFYEKIPLAANEPQIRLGGEVRVCP